MNIHTLQSFFTLKNSLCLGLVVVGLALGGGGLYWLWYGTNQACLTESPSATASEASASAQIATTKPPIYIDVSGAISKPGLYELETGSRLAALIEAAGGFSKTADSQYISQELNLAKQLKDGDKIYIPTKQEAAAQRKATTENSPPGATSPASKQAVSISTSSLAELDALPGIGEKRAQDIIDNRPYTALTELVDKKVLSQTLFDDILELIKL